VSYSRWSRFVLRKHLGSLADRVLEFGFGGATVKFDRLLSKGREIIAESEPAEVSQPEVLPPKEPEASARPPNDERSLRSAIRLLKLWRNTGTPIPQAFVAIENVLEEIGEQLNVKSRNGTLVRMLITRGLLTSDHLELYNTLRKARDAAVHGELDPTITQFKEFTSQAAFLVGISHEGVG
jgi:hypothetical protein